MASDTSLASSPLRAIADVVESIGALDAPGRKIAETVRGAIGPGALRDAISGTWIGHALHPLLTDVVIGSWTSATVLDLIGGPGAEQAAERLIGVGIAAYGPTALTGVSDWADGELGNDGVRRVGLVHAVTNATALALYSVSLVHRRRGNHAKGVSLGLAGLGVASAGGYLGGHLAFRQGVGVDTTVFDAGVEDWTDALAAEDLRDGEPVAVQVGDAPVFVARVGATIHALHDRCSHRGCSLASSGEVSGDAVTCTCHGSRFRLGDGALLRGPATAPQPPFDARERNGRIELRRAAG
jgi:nitrite reductase/ring-hydroxylating ferredoxin subunit/uncharacterized membrane protein